MQNRLQRETRIIQSIAKDAQTISTIAKRLHQPERTVRDDLRRLEQRFPERITRRREDGHSLIAWAGPIPESLHNRLERLDHSELVALVTARAFFRSPGETGFAGPLAKAIDGLLRHMGVADEVHRIDPLAIEVDHFAAALEDPEHMVTAISAVIHKGYLRGRYRNRHDEVNDLHLMPLRLLFIDGEMHILAWLDPQRPLLDLRLSRFLQLSDEHRAPTNAPTHDAPQLHKLITAHRECAFRTHGHHDPSKRERVTLALNPAIIPHLRDRNWGLNQIWDDQPADLPPQWARLSFTTSGLPACYHWVLSLGAGAIAEAPAQLIADLRDNAEATLKHYPKSLTKDIP